MNTPDPLSFKCLFCNKTTTGDHSLFRCCNCNEFDITYCFPNNYTNTNTNTKLSWYLIAPSKQNYKYYAIVFLEYNMPDQTSCPLLAAGVVRFVTKKIALEKIIIYDNNHKPILILPKFNLTPLNFYDKLKIYLTFS